MPQAVDRRDLQEILGSLPVARTAMVVGFGLASLLGPLGMETYPLLSVPVIVLI